MRTKTLLLTAALSAAGVATSMAQVYSVNAVGYYNVTVNAAPGGRPTTYILLGNPLKNGGNTLPEILPNPPEGTIIYGFADGGSYVGPATYASFLGGWDDTTTAFNPGKGFLAGFDSSLLPKTLTFVGEVQQNAASNQTVPSGTVGTTHYWLRSSIVPQEGGLATLLQYPAVDGDLIYLWDETNYSFDGGHTRFLGDWDPPGDPVLKIGRAFLGIRDPSTAQSSWNRNFSVNP